MKRHPYEEWLKENETLADKEDEISSCVPLQAVEKQNSKFSKGLRYTGVAAVVCGRSDSIVQVVNLNKGERYSSMDYLFGMALQIWGGDPLASPLLRHLVPVVSEPGKTTTPLANRY
ncbi:hypothetical protein V5O48_013006 [Marasmius crinis-equi]|uniref:Uncharacterized protein n=1 Tax=Marasmius crinis-equi TaxID=585013 RepID=A0ABR3F181_9AGAR